MGYTIRHGKLVKNQKAKWVLEQDPPEVEQWLGTVNAKMEKMFGPPDPEWGYSHEEERKAEAALAAEGTHPPAEFVEWERRPLRLLNR